MTEKLYLIDGHLMNFTAKVTGCEPKDGAFAVTLDSTAFFPEGGGQGGDRGTVGGANVLNTVEDGEIYHLCDRALPVGSAVDCRIDAALRLDRAQNHTAEHIMSGIIFKRFGYENVGFHLGCDVMTFDTSGVLTKEQIAEIEEEANRVIADDRPVTVTYPSPEELPTLTYRAKLDLKENVRLVTIEGCDVCACCAPHVKSTGEVGSVKIVFAEKHRGGMRLTAVAGMRAVKDARVRLDELAKVSALLSSSYTDAAAATQKLLAALAEREREIKSLRREKMENEADRLAPTAGNLVVDLTPAGDEEMRAYLNRAVKKVEGALVLLTKTDAGYRYLIASSAADVREITKGANAALCGRGGGSAEMTQGSFAASLSDIRSYFKA